jgi:hypothetical protein
MDTRLILGIGVAVVIIALVVFGPGLATTYARNKKLNECETLKAELAAIRIQGGDTNRAEQLEQMIEQCSADAESYGAEIDMGAIRLSSCDFQYNQMEREFVHYRSTSYDDPVKRNNTRTNILKIGEGLAVCYEEAVTTAESVATLDKIRQSLLRAISASTSRRDCFLYDQTGCGRFAVNEDHGNDKALAEEARVLTPLTNVLRVLDSRRALMSARSTSSIASSISPSGRLPLLGV